MSILLLSLCVTLTAAQLRLSPRYREITLRSNDLSIVHIPDRNGDRLRLGYGAPVILTIFDVNDGHVVTSYGSRDVLCLNAKKVFRMLTRPSTNNLPEDCIMYFDGDLVGDADYAPDQRGELCVKEKNQSYKVKLYSESEGKRYYLNVTTTSMSTSYENESSSFEMRHAPCLKRSPVTTFVCYLSRTEWPCENSSSLDKNILEWKHKLSASATITKIPKVDSRSSVYSTTTKRSIQRIDYTTKRSIQKIDSTTKPWFEFWNADPSAIMDKIVFNRGTSKKTSVWIVYSLLCVRFFTVGFV